MASSLCKSTVLKVYHEVMEDVVSGVRELFLEDGVDEQVLQELKQTWEAKLMATKAVDTQSDIEKQVHMMKKEAQSNGQMFNHKNQQAAGGTQAQALAHLHQQQQQQAQPSSSAASAAAAGASTSSAQPQAHAHAHQHQAAQPQAHMVPKVLLQHIQPQSHLYSGQQVIPHSVQQIVETSKQVPIQITLPQQPGTDGPRVLTIQVPVSALQGNQLHKVLTGPVITATMGLPHAIASTLLQQHVNAAFSQQQQVQTQAQAQPQPHTSAESGGQVAKSLQQGDAPNDDEHTLPDFCAVRRRPRPGPGPAPAPRAQVRLRYSRAQAQKVLRSILGSVSDDLNVTRVSQLDGHDTSDEEEEASEDEEPTDDDYDNKEEEDQEMEDGGPEEEPLNSEDDVTDEDPTELFDTDNVVVCQYDKITRARNKWKFHLKDGIMNLNGEDYVFQKASGDAEW